MRTWTPLEKKAGVAALVLVASLFPNLFTVLAWVVGQPLFVGVLIGAVFFAGRRRTAPKPPAAPVTKSAVAA
ncbi:hypothetical protein [Streptomyces sp. NPDC050255]|uniref:hypothetical protein n=1 Tax=Streptomyces sp. NPDC050255 TaxID=3365606 RepID=UPI0037A6698E